MNHQREEAKNREITVLIIGIIFVVHRIATRRQFPFGDKGLLAKSSQ